MNNHLRLYLWKEWRDQRTVIVGLAVAIPGLLALAVAIGGESLREHPLQPTLAAAAGAAIALLTVGMDLIPGEIRRNRVAFLERLPGGLSSAFAAKRCFFYAAVVATATYAWLLGELAHAWPCSGECTQAALVPFTPVRLAGESAWWDPQLTRYVVPSLALGFWAFAISAWIPRSALALPATALIIAILAWPASLFFRPLGAVGPTAVEAWAFLALAVVGAPLVARVSFVRGYRYGTRAQRYVVFGLTAAVLAFAPAWTWTALRLHWAQTVHPALPGFTMNPAFVGAGERFAFINAEQRQPRPVGNLRAGSVYHALRVDLQTGAWERFGAPDSHWSPNGQTIIAPESVWLLESGAETLFDARSGARLDSEAPLEHHGDLLARELGLDPQLRAMHYAGMGYDVYRRIGSGYRRDGFFDPATGRYLSRQDCFALHLARLGPWLPDTFRQEGGKRLVLAAEDARHSRVWIRPGSWLIHPRNDTYWCYEPASGRLRRLRSLDPREDRVGPVLPDGSFLLASQGRAWLFDIESEQRTALDMPAGWRGRVRSVDDAAGGGAWRPVEAPLSSTDVIINVYGDSSQGIARFDPKNRRFEFAEITRYIDSRFLARCDEDSILVAVKSRRIERHWFGSDRSELVFPR